MNLTQSVHTPTFSITKVPCVMCDGKGRVANKTLTGEIKYTKCRRCRGERMVEKKNYENFNKEIH